MSKKLTAFIGVLLCAVVIFGVAPRFARAEAGVVIRGFEMRFFSDIRYGGGGGRRVDLYYNGVRIDSAQPAAGIVDFSFRVRDGWRVSNIANVEVRVVIDATNQVLQVIPLQDFMQPVPGVFAYMVKYSPDTITVQSEWFNSSGVLENIYVTLSSGVYYSVLPDDSIWWWWYGAYDGTIALYHNNVRIATESIDGEDDDWTSVTFTNIGLPMSEVGNLELRLISPPAGQVYTIDRWPVRYTVNSGDDWISVGMHTTVVDARGTQPIPTQTPAPPTPIPASVTVNNQAITFVNQQPLIIDQVTFVPVRGVFEHMGFKAEWFADTREAILTNGDTVVTIPADGTTFTVNDETITPQAPQRLINGRLMLPLRAIAEALGATPQWDEATRTANISTN